jgi:hypothetical protein
MRSAHQYIGFAVRASVEVIMVRAVEPHVNRCRGGSQNTGQAGAIHHHIGCVVAAQQVEDRIDGPAVVAGLDGDTHPFRQAAQEVVEPLISTFLVGRQLDPQQSRLGPYFSAIS